MDEGAWLALYFLTEAEGRWEEPVQPYGLAWEEYQAQELAAFVRLASEEFRRRQIAPETIVPHTFARVRITRTLRVFIGTEELKLRPLSKSVLLLFLKHPEGIPLKQVAEHRDELAGFYRRVSRSDNAALIEQRIQRIVNVFEGDLPVQIARVNAAVARLVDGSVHDLYRIAGPPGMPKRIPLDRSWVVWE